MNRLDKLLDVTQKANDRIQKEAYQNLGYTDDEDSFLEAMRIDKVKYAVELPDGRILYDIFQAMNDVAASEDWEEI